MAKQIINIGSAEYAGDGESIRSALNKTNANFDELYSIAQDFNAINASIIPDTDLAYDLGSADKRFRDLYLSGNTLDLGGTTLSVSNNVLQINGVDINDVVVANGIDYNLLQNTPNLNKYVKFTDIQGATITVDVNNTGNLQGSVFADDSTLLVDGLAGKITGDVINSSVTTAVVNASTDDLYVTAVNNGKLFLGTTNTESITIGASDTTVYLNGNQDSIVVAGQFIGDLSGSIFADNSVLLVDGVNGLIPSAVISGTEATNWNTAYSWGDHSKAGYLAASAILDGTLTIDVNNTGDLLGSVFGDDSTLLVDSISSQIVGPINTQTDIELNNNNIESINAINSELGVHSILMNENDSLKIVSSESIEITGGASANIEIGTATSGNVTLGSGTNTVNFVSGTSVDFANTTVTGFGLTYSDGGVSTEVGVTADVFDFGDGKTIDMQNSSVLLNGSTVSAFTQSETSSGVYGINTYTTTIEQDGGYTKFSKTDVINEEFGEETYTTTLQFDRSGIDFEGTGLGTSFNIRNTTTGGDVNITSGGGNPVDGERDAGDIDIRASAPASGGVGGNVVINSNTGDIFIGPLSGNTNSIKIGGGPKNNGATYGGGVPTTFYGAIDFNGQSVNGLTNINGPLNVSSIGVGTLITGDGAGGDLTVEGGNNATGLGGDLNLRGGSAPGEDGAVNITGPVNITGDRLDLDGQEITNVNSVTTSSNQPLNIISNGTEVSVTNAVFQYDTNSSGNVKNTFYGTTVFENNGEPAVVDFNGQTVTGTNFIESDTTGITGADAVSNIVTLTQSEYDAIGTPNASTVYIIVG